MQGLLRRKEDGLLMKQVKLIYQERDGLFPEVKGIAPVVHEVRATIPVVELLRSEGATVVPLAMPEYGYMVTLGKKMPKGIVAIEIPNSIGLRLENEPEYPMEHPNYWAQLMWTPCPKCSAPIVWYEAGYVPGYRVCTGRKHHHSLAK